MAPVVYDGGSEDSSEDEDFNFESSIGSRKFPVHDCCEYEDAESLKRLIFVRQDDSDDSSSSSSSSASSEDQGLDDTATSSENEQKLALTALHSNDSRQSLTNDTLENVKEVNESSEIEPSSVSTNVEKIVEAMDTKTDQERPKELSDPSERDPTQISKEEKPSGSDDCDASEKNLINDKDSNELLQTEEKEDKPITNIEEKEIGTDEKKEVSKDNVAQSQNVTEDKLVSIHESMKDDSNLTLESKKHLPYVGANSIVTPPDSTQHSSNNDTNDNPTKEQSNIPKNESDKSVQARKKKRRKKSKEPEYYCPYDLDQRDNDENTPLHVAIHFRKLECVRLLLEAGADHAKRSDGSAPVHLAVSMGAIPEHTDFAEKCLTLLGSFNADFSLKDESLHTPLYLACMSNVPRCAQIILADPNGLSTLNMRSDRIGGRPLHACAKYCLSTRRVGLRASNPHRRISAAHLLQRHGAGKLDDTLITEVLLSAPGVEVDAVNNYGQTPLHVAASRGNWATARLLLKAGANPVALDRRNCTPGNLAVKRGIAIPNDLESHLGLLSLSDVIGSDNKKRDLIIDPDASTILLCHDLCTLHKTCAPIRRGNACVEPPPENVRRLHVLINPSDGILRCGEFQSCSWESEARRASIADVLRVHEYPYVERISQLCASIPDHPSAISSLDPDTAVSHFSFEAAMRAAGSVCEAVDKVMVGDHRNAFCVVRPPGHHAGPRGIVTCPNDSEGSHGFCLLNNVAIGAAYARSMYRNDGLKKVAIIDFDVHHGNGTEEIIRQLVPNIQTSALRTPFAVGSLHTSRYKPWLNENDINEVFFASTHGYGPRELCFSNPSQVQGGWFYPASGKSFVSDAVRDPTSVEKQSVTDFISTQTWARMGDESRYNCCKIIDVGLDLPHPYDVPGMQRIELRDAYRKKILPYLVDFNPDMIFVSAGFDGHKRDGMNFGYVGMIEDDYEWVTEQLIKVANTCCQGRIVSVLEGGYKIHGGIVSPFARSVASHVRALVEGGTSREMYSAEDGVWESDFERHLVHEKEKRRKIRIEKIKVMEMEKRRMKNIPSSSAENVNEVLDRDETMHDIEHSKFISNNTHHDLETIMKEPLSEIVNVAASNVMIPDTPDISLQHFGGASPSPFHVGASDSQHSFVDESQPSRKRRRNPVDYRELFEQMKKEEKFHK